MRRLVAALDAVRGATPESPRHDSGALAPPPTELGLPPEWLVVVPGAAQTIYRLVSRDPPRDRDFYSDRMKQRPRGEGVLETDHLGLSVFASEEQAFSMARRYPKYVARVVLEPGHGLALARTILDLPGHYTIWGTPEELLAQVSSVTRRDEEGNG